MCLGSFVAVFRALFVHEGGAVGASEGLRSQRSVPHFSSPTVTSAPVGSGARRPWLSAPRGGSFTGGSDSCGGL